jgi:hypothetical protein
VSPRRRQAKVRERYFAKLVLAKVDADLLSELHDAEQPDFLVPGRRPSLGIEVRELFEGQDSKGRPLRASEGLEDKITHSAETLWRDRGLPAVLVGLSWDPYELPATRRRDEIARRVVDAIAAKLPEMLDGVRLDISNFDEPGDPLPKEISSVRVARSSTASNSFWTTTRAGDVGECLPQAVEAALREKERRLNTYRRRANEVWLILGISEDAPSSFVDVPQATTRQTYESGFDRVFLVEAFKRRVTELTVSRVTENTQVRSPRC